MPIRFATDPSVTGDVRMRVLDNDGLVQPIINEALDSFSAVEWEITGPHFWAYASNDSVRRVRVGPAREHAFPPPGQPAHRVRAKTTASRPERIPTSRGSGLGSISTDQIVGAVQGPAPTICDVAS